MIEDITSGTTCVPQSSDNPRCLTSLRTANVEAENVFEFRQWNETLVQSNLFITDTKGTGISVRIIEVSVLERLALYGFQSLRDQVNCP